MIYLTSDAIKNKEELGIEESDMQKLYTLAKSTNRFLKNKERALTFKNKKQEQSKGESYVSEQNIIEHESISEYERDFC